MEDLDLCTWAFSCFLCSIFHGNSTICDPSFVDPFLSLIISFLVQFQHRLFFSSNSQSRHTSSSSIPLYLYLGAERPTKGGRHRILLKVLLDSGSTTTMINRKRLPRNCQTCKISNSRKIGTLAGSYTSSEMVVLHNLKLPELDKKHNVDQQKALIFDSDSCR
jgi:hypothetical protein